MKNLTYKQAGVDVKKGDAASRKSSELARTTYRPDVEELAGIPALSAAFSSYKNPMLLGATDGVGTKLKIAFALRIHHTIGIDLVAMSVNDLVRRGAEPLLFLPYLATGKVDPSICAKITEGIVEGCKIANCSILGGETAELTDLYQKGEYDVAGSAVGVVEKSQLITGENITEGDVVIGIPSSGLHSNGFTLARKVLLSEFALNDRPNELEGLSIGEEMLVPTRIYVRPILAMLRKKITIHGLAHITGGGIPSKLGKIIPAGLTAKIQRRAWKIPSIFALIQKKGGVAESEMFHAFNMGLGFIIVAPKKSVASIQKEVPDCILVGSIEKGTESVRIYS